MAKAPPLSQDQIASLRAIFAVTHEQQRRLADTGLCRWNDCGKPMTSWAAEQTDGIVPVCATCVAEHELTLGKTPL